MLREPKDTQATELKLPADQTRKPYPVFHVGNTTFLTDGATASISPDTHQRLEGGEVRMLQISRGEQNNPGIEAAGKVGVNPYP